MFGQQPDHLVAASIGRANNKVTGNLSRRLTRAPGMDPRLKEHRDSLGVLKRHDTARTECVNEQAIGFIVRDVTSDGAACPGSCRTQGPRYRLSGGRFG